MLKRIKEIRECLTKGLYEAALALALTLPDICGAVEYPGAGNGDRYKNWINNFVKPELLRDPVIAAMKIIGLAREDMESITADDIYQLRCSFLHSGDVDLNTQRIDEFELVKPGTLKTRVPIRPAGNFSPEQLLSMKNETTEEVFGYKIVQEQVNGDTIHKIKLDIKYICDVLCDSAKEYYDKKTAQDFANHTWTLH